MKLPKLTFKLPSLTIRWRLRIVLGLLMLMLLVGALIGFGSIQLQNEALRHTYQEELVPANLISSLNRRRVAYSCALKHFGLYGPRLFSSFTAWCTWPASWAETALAPAVVSVTLIPMLRSRSRRERSRFSSDIAFPHFLGQVLRHPPRKRHNA